MEVDIKQGATDSHLRKTCLGCKQFKTIVLSASIGNLLLKMAQIKWQAAAKKAISARNSLSTDRKSMQDRMRQLLNQIEIEGSIRKKNHSEDDEDTNVVIEAKKEILYLFRANRDFVKESLKSCLKFSTPGHLRSYLQLARRAVGTGEEQEHFWKLLFLLLYETAVEKGNVSSLKVLLTSAHDPSKPILLSKPEVNCRALIHACLKEDRHMVNLFVEKGYILECVDEKIIKKKKEKVISSWMGLPFTHPPDDEDDYEVNLSSGDDVTNLHIMAAMSKPCYLLTCYSVANNKIRQCGEHVCNSPNCTCKGSLRLDTVDAVNPQFKDNDNHCCPQAKNYKPELGCKHHLPCNDPIYWSFKLRKMALKGTERRPEYKDEYKEIANSCSDLPVNQLDLCQDTGEVALVLEDETGCESFFDWSTVGLGSYPRLQMAIFNNDMSFISQKYCQQILRNLWYGNVPWAEKSFTFCTIYFLIQGLMLIWWCIIYMLKLLIEDFPKMEKVFYSKRVISYIKRHGNLDEPFNRFLSYSIMYLVFVCLLTTCAFNPIINPSELTNNFQLYHQLLALVTISYCLQDIFSLVTCVSNIKGTTFLFWKAYDFIVEFLVLTAFFVRLLMGGLHECPNEDCDVDTLENRLPYDTVSNCFFATASVMGYLRLLYWFQLVEKMGPIIIQLSRVIIDVLTFVYVLGVLMVAFTTALVPLKAINMRCDNFTETVFGDYNDSTMALEEYEVWFQNSDVSSVEDEECWYYFTGDHFHVYFTQMLGLLFWGILNPEYPDDEVFHNDSWEGVFAITVYAIYCVVAIIILLNLLVAIMNNTIQRVHDRKNTYWKFVRSTIWMEFFGEAYALPPPFGLFVIIRALIRTCWRKVSEFFRKEKVRKIFSIVISVQVCTLPIIQY